MKNPIFFCIIFLTMLSVFAAPTMRHEIRTKLRQPSSIVGLDASTSLMPRANALQRRLGVSYSRVSNTLKWVKEMVLSKISTWTSEISARANAIISQLVQQVLNDKIDTTEAYERKTKAIALLKAFHTAYSGDPNDYILNQEAFKTALENAFDSSDLGTLQAEAIDLSELSDGLDDDLTARDASNELTTVEQYTNAIMTLECQSLYITACTAADFECYPGNALRCRGVQDNDDILNLYLAIQDFDDPTQWVATCKEADGQPMPNFEGVSTAQCNAETHSPFVSYCIDNDDCGTDYNCIDATCHHKDACTEDADCYDTNQFIRHCLSGRCRPLGWCQENDDCSSKTCLRNRCREEGTCTENRVSGDSASQMTSTSSCPWNTRCETSDGTRVAEGHWFVNQHSTPQPSLHEVRHKTPSATLVTPSTPTVNVQWSPSNPPRREADWRQNVGGYAKVSQKCSKVMCR